MGLRGYERTLLVQSLIARQTYSSQKHLQGSRRLLKDILVSWDGYQLRIDELTKGKDDKGKGDKKSDKGLVAKSFDWDDESVSSKDEGKTKFKAFMAISDDEPSMGNDQRNNLVNKFNALKQDLALHNESLKDEISGLKKVIEKWTCSKISLDQLLSEQIPSNIVKALGEKGRRKENNSKEVLFTKANVSTSDYAPMITSDSKDDSDNQDYLKRYSKESSPKVVFGDNSSGDTEGYVLVNCNGITFTKVAYVNGLKHTLISISQLCDANFKVLFIKTQRTIFNEKDKVVLIAPRRRDVYVIDMSS
nr:retrovirus-related Pol polyprotein from transposon TNT 1-94 [Tanacetum cinerariifolium]